MGIRCKSEAAPATVRVKPAQNTTGVYALWEGEQRVNPQAMRPASMSHTPTWVMCLTVGRGDPIAS